MSHKHLHWYVQLGLPHTNILILHTTSNMYYLSNRSQFFLLCLLNRWITKPEVFVFWFWPRLICMVKEVACLWRQPNCTHRCRCSWMSCCYCTLLLPLIWSIFLCVCLLSSLQQPPNARAFIFHFWAFPTLGVKILLCRKIDLVFLKSNGMDVN